MPPAISLEALPSGAEADVESFATGISAARLCALGLGTGCRVTLLQRGPGRSVIVRAGGQRLALRANEAAAVYVRRAG
jgi:Fe2+ transport system protein FeoA